MYPTTYVEWTWLKEKQGVHYVNKCTILGSDERSGKKRCKEAEELGDPQPPVTNYIGECFLKIANHLSYRPNFINYTYRDEMISDGIETVYNIVATSTQINTKNPFAYFTQIIYYAFIRRIQKEKETTTYSTQSN